MRGARSPDTTALLFTLHLGCQAQGPMQEGRIQAARGSLSPTPKKLLLGQERAEGGGQRSGVRFQSLKSLNL